MLKKGYLQYTFLHEVHEAINRYKEDTLLSKLPSIIEEHLPLTEATIFYKQKEVFNGFSSSELPGLPQLSLSSESLLTTSFSKRKLSLHINNGLSSYISLFNKETFNLISDNRINFIHPIFHKNLYKGILMGNYKGKTKEISVLEELINIASSLIITSIETENSTLLSDLNYYRLYKFDRLALLGEMTASIAHELRTPINTVILEIDEVASESITTEEKQESIDIIKAETFRLNDFITSLLSFSRLRKRGLTKISIQKFVEDAIRRIPSKRKPKDISISTSFKDAPFVSTDRDRLLQVFYNVIFNAFDAVGENGEISISTYIKDPSKNSAILEVKDNGPGIPENLKSRITQPFFTTKEEGTGLGLYISSNIMKELGGSLDIESSDKGTTIFLTISMK